MMITRQTIQGAPKSKQELVVRRPDGALEVVDVTGRMLGDALVAQMAAATAKAGRGEIIEWREYVEVIPVHRDATCPRCGTVCYGDCR